MSNTKPLNLSITSSRKELEKMHKSVSLQQWHDYYCNWPVYHYTPSAKTREHLEAVVWANMAAVLQDVTAVEKDPFEQVEAFDVSKGTAGNLFSIKAADSKEPLLSECVSNTLRAHAALTTILASNTGDTLVRNTAEEISKEFEVDPSLKTELNDYMFYRLFNQKVFGNKLNPKRALDSFKDSAQRVAVIDLVDTYDYMFKQLTTVDKTPKRIESEVEQTLAYLNGIVELCKRSEPIKVLPWYKLMCKVGLIENVNLFVETVYNSLPANFREKSTAYLKIDVVRKAHHEMLVRFNKERLNTNAIILNFMSDEEEDNKITFKTLIEELVWFIVRQLDAQMDYYSAAREYFSRLESIGVDARSIIKDECVAFKEYNDTPPF